MTSARRTAAATAPRPAAPPVAVAAATAPAARGPTYRDALAGREFRAMLAAGGTSIAGAAMAAVALTVEVFDRTRSPLLSGLVDRVPPRRLQTVCLLGSAGLIAVMSLPWLPVPALLALLIGTGTLTSVASGAQGGLIRIVVPPRSYVPARSLLRIAAQVAQIAGNALGGAALALLTVHGAFLISAAAVLVAAVTVRFGLGSHPAAGGASGPLLLDSLRGVRTVLGYRELRRLMLLSWLVPMFMVAPEALGAPYVAGQGGSAALVGGWLCALPVGMIAGDLLGVLAFSPRRQRGLVGVAAAASFVPYLGFVGRPPVVVALPVLAAAGLCGVYSLGLDALIRSAVPERLFARAMAVSSAGLITVQGLGFALAGATAQLIGPAWAIAAAGGCGLVTVAILRPRGKAAGGPQ